MGHPLLRQPGRALDVEELADPKLDLIVTDMIDTLHDYGGIGLAAPQIGESLRLAIIEIEVGSSRYGDIPAMPLTIFVNPTIEVIDATTDGYWEGCLSVPGLRGYVKRPRHIRVDYLDLQGETRGLELRGFLSTVFQHEFDHLDGTLYVDRLTDMKLLSFEREYSRYWLPLEEQTPSAPEEPSADD